MAGDGRHFIFIDRMMVPEFEELCALLRAMTDHHKRMMVL